LCFKSYIMPASRRSQIYPGCGQLHSVSFLDVTPCYRLIGYRCFGINLHIHLHGWKYSLIFRPLNMRPLGCLKTSNSDVRLTETRKLQQHESSIDAVFNALLVGTSLTEYSDFVPRKLMHAECWNPMTVIFSWCPFCKKHYKNSICSNIFLRLCILAWNCKYSECIDNSCFWKHQTIIAIYIYIYIYTSVQLLLSQIVPGLLF
jgi:hypothetical protein